MKTWLSKNYKYLLALSVSLILHGLFYWSVSYKASHLSFCPPTSIEILYPKRTQKTQKAQLRELLKKLKKQQRILSDKTRRVKRESLAQKSELKHDLFSPSSKRKKQHQLEAQKTAPEAIIIKQRGGMEGKQVSSLVPQVKMGGFTSLNTDQFVFYTFYSRTNEQVGPRWIFNLRTYANDLSRASLKSVSRKERITQIEILLDKNGKYLDTIVHQKSGIAGLDEAAINAFKQASPFLNPPEEMVQSDGNIHLHYSFHILWNPQTIAYGSR